MLPADTNEDLLTTEITVRDEEDPNTIQADVILKLNDEIIGSVPMNKEVTEYDISFEATTMPSIINGLNWFSVGVLIMFILGHLIFAIKKDAQK